MLSRLYVFTLKSSLPAQDFFAVKTWTQPLWKIVMLLIIMGYNAYNLSTTEDPPGDKQWPVAYLKRYLHLNSFKLTMKWNFIPWMQKNYDTK